jgi:hypothetical protein
MTKIIFSDEVHKVCDSDSDDLENILRTLVDKNGICRTCGCDHSPRGKKKILDAAK